MRERVLVAAPTSSRHIHLIDEYVNQFNSFSYPEKGLLLIDTGESYGHYAWMKSRFESNRIAVLKGPYLPNALERISHARNIIRHFASDHNFTHILFLDTDTFIPSDSIERLLSHKKELVGFICAIKSKGGNPQIVALKSGNLLILKDREGKSVKALDYHDNGEILSQKPNLIKVYSCPMSPLLVSRKVFEKTPFRYIPSHPFGEDIGFHIENNDNGFEYYLDTSVIAEHLQIENGWKNILK